MGRVGVGVVLWWAGIGKWFRLVSGVGGWGMVEGGY